MIKYQVHFLDDLSTQLMDFHVPPNINEIVDFHNEYYLVMRVIHKIGGYYPIIHVKRVIE